MTVTTSVLYDDAEKTVFRDVDSVAGATTVRTVWKTGTAQDNALQLQVKAQSALAANLAFLALASPTNAQTLAQVQLLSRECDALIRLTLSLSDSTAGT